MTDYRELEERLRKRHLLGDCVLAADAIKALREAYDEGYMFAHAQAQAQIIKALRDRVAELEKALRRYGSHDGPDKFLACKTYGRNPEMFDCSCGFDAALSPTASKEGGG